MSPITKYFCYASLTNPKLNENQWTELINILQEESESFIELESTEEGDVAALRKFRSDEAGCPLANSLAEMSSDRITGKTELAKEFDLSAATLWASKAAELFHKKGRKEQSEGALKTCWKGAYQLLGELYRPSDALRVIQSIGIPVKEMSEENQAIYHELLGLIFQHSDRHMEAIPTLTVACELRLKMNQPEEVAWLHGKLGWSFGALDRLEEAIKAHRMARNQKLSLGASHDPYWNLGQIARYTIRLKSLEAAWEILDSDESATPINRINSLQQLGDAVLDAVHYEGEVKAFALAYRILVGISERPHYNPSAAIRAGSIRLIDMGAPLELLRDILGEIPQIFQSHKNGLISLCKVLHAWIDDLAIDANRRAEHRSALDPDLATTLESLSESLSPRGLTYYGIDQNRRGES